MRRDTVILWTLAGLVLVGLIFFGVGKFLPEDSSKLVSVGGSIFFFSLALIMLHINVTFRRNIAELEWKLSKLREILEEVNKKLEELEQSEEEIWRGS